MSQNDEFYAQLPFSLSEGEKVITSIKPVWKGYFLRFSLGHIITALFISLFISSIPTFYISSYISNSLGLFLSIFLGVFIFITIISIAVAKISYRKFTVWLTNERIVSARGLIGFNTESMPLESIMDVVLNRGIIDRMLGLSSIMSVPMGGMMMGGRGSNFSTVGFIPALKPDDAVKLQKQIFDLRNARKKALREG